MAPIEILYQFNSDRSQSQQITVRLDSTTGEYSTVDDTTVLENYGGVGSDDRHDPLKSPLHRFAHAENE
eukprot:COSAG06_NODE_50947_length_315_cov_0.861111_1_plen_68_part_10